MEFFRIHKDIPFMRHALVFNVLSLITFLMAVVFLFTRGLHLSVEFTGGTLVEINYKDTANVEAIRETLEKAGLKVEVQNFGSSRDVLCRTLSVPTRLAAVAAAISVSAGLLSVAG